jgi:hypothetical protein
MYARMPASVSLVNCLTSFTNEAGEEAGVWGLALQPRRWKPAFVTKDDAAGMKPVCMCVLRAASATEAARVPHVRLFAQWSATPAVAYGAFDRVLIELRLSRGLST